MSERLSDEEYRAWIDAGSPNALEAWAIIIALRAERAKLETALRSVRKNIPEGCSTAFMIINEALAQPAESSEPFDGPIMATLVRNNDTLRAALEPFAAAHFYYSDAGKPDDCRTGIGGVTYGDFRRAVSVLAAVVRWHA